MTTPKSKRLVIVMADGYTLKLKIKTCFVLLFI
jgi:hypothetical protein